MKVTVLEIMYAQGYGNISKNFYAHPFAACASFSAVSEVAKINNRIAASIPAGSPAPSEDNDLREFVPKHRFNFANSGKPDRLRP